MKYFVIGSGPSGIAAAHALLSKNLDVTMLDYANTLDEAIQEKVKHIKETPINKWDKNMTTWIRSHPGEIKGNMPLKLIFTSNYPYREANEEIGVIYKNCGIQASLAQGGFSNVWGSGVFPFIDQDNKNWPIYVDDLVPYYKIVHDIMPISANLSDSLSKKYPIYGSIFSRNLVPQAEEFYGFLEQDKQYLLDAGITYGYSRNAYSDLLCEQCGLCTYGCPYNLIYSSRFTLAQLLKNVNFTYIPNVLVDRFSEEDGQVKLFVTDKYSKVEEQYICDKVFIGAGVISTAKMVLKSVRSDKKIFMKETPYFLFPIINFKLKQNVLGKSFNTLSQIFIDINDPAISKYSIVLQVYPYNELLQIMIKKKIGRALYKIFTPLINFILNRTMIIQGFFHSEEGKDIELQLQSGGKLLVTGYNHNMGKKIKLVLKKISRYGIIPTVEEAMPGKSFHCGGTFPMSNTPKELTTDIQGRLFGFQNVHLVDASIFPSIPAQTITYTIMANAYRIAIQSSE